MKPYHDRREAGMALAHALAKYANQTNTIVLALPRGGVPVAYELAKALRVPLDVFIVRKLGVPDHPELAMGAIAEGGCTILNHDIIRECRVSPEALQAVKKDEWQELARRQLVYRQGRPLPDIQHKTIILVDDGVATGASLRAAIDALKMLKPAKLIVAVPVADPQVAGALAKMVDSFICPLQPAVLNAVGAWYEQFPQVDDDTVHRMLSS
ncbi:MAG TPA: phosphoribosyltransferase [Gammaproteobacteria bacterium]|nr:phosphoribosyltransferase [Gammaproteobacteria bacterium]